MLEEEEDGGDEVPRELQEELENVLLAVRSAEHMWCRYGSLMSRLLFLFGSQ